jgi:TonB-linked SusC/RagA family outer membrane protein
MQIKGVWSLLLMLILSTSIANAQQKLVSGKIVNFDKAPLSNVSVVVKGTKVATTSDNNGGFSINVSSKETLVFSLVGYETKEVKVGDKQTIDVRLTATDNTLEEVVVTAMDIKRNPKELGYSVQKIKGSEIAETQRNNFVNSLQGRVAGLTVNPTSGMAGASSQLVLRGFNSLSLDNSPLFIVDGIILDNQSVSENNRNTGLAVKPSSASVSTENRQNDYTNRIADINPNDIENVTVLKGPEATALYGSQASGGAIVITTKKGTNSGGKINVNYDNSFKSSTYTRYPSIMTDYDAGYNGANSDLFAYFGPKLGAEVKRYNNLNNFFESSFSQTHNLSLEYGVKNHSVRFSGAFLDDRSPIPTNRYTKNNIRIISTHKFGKKLEISPSLSYVSSQNDKPLRGISGYLLNLLAWPVDDNAAIWQDANGNKKQLFSGSASLNTELDNPYFNVNRNRSHDEVSRTVAAVSVNYNPTTWLQVNGRMGYDTYTQDGYTKWDSTSYFLLRSQKGALENYYRKYYGYNHTVTATAKKSIDKINMRLMVGNMWQDYETQTTAIFGTDIADANRTDSANTNPLTRIRNSNMIRFGRPNYNINRQAAYFGEAAINYDNKVFFTYSHRFEESSIFPVQNRAYDYPAGSVSVIMTDIFPSLKDDVNYWKLRGSLASTARSSAPYANQSLLAFNIGSGGGYYYDFTNANTDLRPEKQQTFEIGSEIKLFNNRLSVEGTYYKTKNKDLIAEGFRASYGTGFVLNTLNVGSNQNTGIEVVLDYQIVSKKNFSWSTRLNFNRMRNKVISLPPNVPEFYISDTWVLGARGGLVTGGPTTTITSFGYMRNTAGDILIDPATGIPYNDGVYKVHGDRNPDFTIGWLNNIVIKDLRISFLWDLKVGGDVFNGTDKYLTSIGRSERTADRTTPRVVSGVLKDGYENTMTPTKNTIAITPYNQFTYFSTMPEEEFIEKDVNWFRLRDISFNYNLKKYLGGSAAKTLKSLSAFLTINDLILLTNYSGPDPAVGANSSAARGVSGFGFDYGNMGAPVSFNMGIRTSF